MPRDRYRRRRYRLGTRQISLDCQEFRDRCIEADTGQQAAADIAIGNGVDQVPMLVNDIARPIRALRSMRATAVRIVLDNEMQKSEIRVLLMIRL